MTKTDVTEEWLGEDYQARVLTAEEEARLVERARTDGRLTEREALVMLDSHRLQRAQVERFDKMVDVAAKATEENTLRRITEAVEAERAKFVKAGEEWQAERRAAYDLLSKSGNCDSPLATMIRSALKLAAKEERTAVVAWLRAQAEHYPPDIFPPESASRDAISGHALRTFSVLWASRIEAREHHAEPEAAAREEGPTSLAEAMNRAVERAIDKQVLDGLAAQERKEAGCALAALAVPEALLKNEEGRGPSYAHARAALGAAEAKEPGCALCGKPLAYPGARFCGAGCTARWEAGDRPEKPKAGA